MTTRFQSAACAGFPVPFLDELAALVGAANVLTNPTEVARYTRDWRGNYPGLARAVVRPASTAEVAQVLRACAARGVCVVPQGGNTGLVGGSTPDASGTEVVLSLGRLNAVRWLQPLDNTLTLEAGCSVRQAQEAAAAQGRLFAISLASEGSATIGGVLSTNAGGEQVLRYGNTRELTLGLEVVLADGRVLDGLTALRKDNTGYDLKQLFIGSEGTLGVITAATFKLHSPPRQVITVWAAVSGPQAAVELLASLHSAVGERVTAFELISAQALALVLAHPVPGMRGPLAEPADWQVLFDVSETSARLDPTPVVEELLTKAIDAGLVADAVLAASLKQAQALWALRDHISEAQRFEGPSIKHDIAVAVSRVPEFIARADQALRQFMPGVRIVCFGHVGDGNLHYNQSKPLQLTDTDFHASEAAMHDLVHRIVVDMQGSISAEHGIGRLKQSVLLQYKSPLALELMARIKQTLDPAGLLNPGRVLPRPNAEPTAF